MKKVLQCLIIVCWLFTRDISLVRAELSLPSSNWPNATMVNGHHLIKVLNSGASSLAKYLEMIENSDHSISLLNYIFTIDNSGKAIGKALINRVKRAKAEGKIVSIRIINDFYGWSGQPGINEFITDIFKASGIEVRFFNIENALNPMMLNFRDHRKFMIVDESEVILGGRNIGDDCFEIHPYFNYLDRDVWVRGGVASAVQDSFDKSWGGVLAGNIDQIRRAGPREFDLIFGQNGRSPRNEKIKTIMKREYEDVKENFLWSWNSNTPEDRLLMKKVFAKGIQDLTSSPVFSSNKVYFTSGEPDLSHMHSADSFLEVVRQTKKEIVFENYTFIPANGFKDILEKFVKSGGKMRLLTNSYVSTDEPDIIYMSHLRQTDYSKLGAQVFAYASVPPLEWIPATSQSTSKNVTWGIHSKTAVFDGLHTWIGSNNLDARSDLYSLEAAIMVPDNRELAQYVKSLIETRIKRSYEVLPDGKYSDGPKAQSKGSPLKRAKYWLLNKTVSEFLY